MQVDIGISDQAMEVEGSASDPEGTQAPLDSALRFICLVTLFSGQ